MKYTLSKPVRITQETLNNTELFLELLPNIIQKMIESHMKALKINKKIQWNVDLIKNPINNDYIFELISRVDESLLTKEYAHILKSEVKSDD